MLEDVSNNKCNVLCLADDSKIFDVSMMCETEIIICEKYVSKQSFPINLFLGADRKLAANWQVIIVIAISTISWVLACDLALRTSFLSSI